MGCEHRWRAGRADVVGGLEDVVCMNCDDRLALRRLKKDHECRWTKFDRYVDSKAIALVCEICGARTDALLWVKQTQHAGAINRAMQAAGYDLAHMLIYADASDRSRRAVDAWETVCGRAPAAAEPADRLLDLLIRLYGNVGMSTNDFLEGLKELKRNET